jgi:hypothetical protein
MGFADTGDDTELENEDYYFTLDKFFKKAFTLLNKRYKKKKKKKSKDKTLYMINDEDLFDFILDKNYHDNNMDIFLHNNLSIKY